MFFFKVAKKFIMVKNNIALIYEQCTASLLDFAGSMIPTLHLISTMQYQKFSLLSSISSVSVKISSLVIVALPSEWSKDTDPQLIFHIRSDIQKISVNITTSYSVFGILV